MSQKRSFEASSSSEPPVGSTKDQVFLSSPIKDRASTFIAAYSPQIPAKTLQSREDFQSATHRILGWRKPSKQQSLGFSDSKSRGKGLFTTGSDDDGEKYAGKKLEKVLTELNAEGAVVVARWYGGVLLGPARFTHIENAAKEAILKYQSEHDQQLPLKKPKVEISPSLDPAEEIKKKEILAQELQKRDESITTLRDLLQQVKAKVKTATAPTDSSGSPKTATSSPIAKLDYNSMPLQKLRQLDKARDATISWLLKQIDAAEQAAKNSKP